MVWYQVAVWDQLVRIVHLSDGIMYVSLDTQMDAVNSPFPDRGHRRRPSTSCRRSGLPLQCLQSRVTRFNVCGKAWLRVGKAWSYPESWGVCKWYQGIEKRQAPIVHKGAWQHGDKHRFRPILLVRCSSMVCVVSLFFVTSCYWFRSILVVHSGVYDRAWICTSCCLVFLSRSS